MFLITKLTLVESNNRIVTDDILKTPTNRNHNIRITRMVYYVERQAAKNI